MVSVDPGTNIGDLIYWDGSSWVTLSPGTSGQLLFTQGVGASPKWGDQTFIFEGDYLSWDYQWSSVLPGGLYDEWDVDWIVDEVNEKVIFSWLVSGKGNRILVLDLLTGSQLSLTANNYCAATLYNVEKGGLTRGGGIQANDNAFSRTTQTYFVALLSDGYTHEVWRHGLPLFRFNPGFDMAHSYKDPVTGMSPSGKWIIAINGSGGSGVGDIVCYKGNAEAQDAQLFGGSICSLTGENSSYTTVRDLASSNYLGGIMVLGQEKNSVYWVSRTGVVFDTSFLSGKTITSAKLQLSMSSLYVVDGNLGCQVQYGGGTYPSSPCVKADYDRSKYSGDGGSLIPLTLGGNDIPLNSTGISWINKTGLTRFMLRSLYDIAGTPPISIRKGAGYCVGLYVEYTT